MSAQASTVICDRTEEVQLGIWDRLPDARATELDRDGKNEDARIAACADITSDDLASLTTFRRVEKPGFTSLKSGDFAGMTGLTTLDIQNNEIRELPVDIFDGLDAVTDLRFSNNDIEDLPAGVFSGLPALEILVGSGNRLTHFKADWFDGFQGFPSTATSADIRLEFVGNQITTIDANALDGMDGLKRFYFSYNKIRSLPAGLFDGLSSLQRVSLHFNELPTLPAGLFDRLTADGTVGSNSSLQRLNVNDNNLRSLPSGIFGNLAGLQQVRLHNNSLTSLPIGLFDNNPGLYEVRLSNNQITSLPSGLFSNNVGMQILNLDNNRIRSLDGLELEKLTWLLDFAVHNNQLSQLPDVYVTRFVEDSKKATGEQLAYCLRRLTLDNNPLADSWVASGSFNDYLTAFGSRFNRTCSITAAAATYRTFALVLGLGGIDLSVEVTDESKTAWQLLAEDFADSSRYLILYHFSFGWDGLEVDTDVIDALPTTLEELKIQDASFDSSVTGTSFARFTKTVNIFVRQYFFRRIGDPILNIDHVESAGLGGLQILRLDNVGLSGDGSRIVDGLPVSTMRLLEITNNPGFNQIPASARSLTNLVGLDLKSNGITSLDANALQGLSNLIFLSVEDNEVDTVHEDALNGLSALRTLLMDDNEIATLPGDLFSGSSALRDVHLTNNELLGLPSGLLDGVSALKTIQLQSNPGAPFQIGVSVVDDTTDATMKQLHIREGAPYDFVPKVVKDGAIESVVPVTGGTTITTNAFSIPEGASVVLPAFHPDRPSSTYEFCLGVSDCYAGFEFVLDPKPSIVSMSFDNPSQLFTAGDKLRFKALFDRDVVVDGKPQLSFTLGDDTRHAVYVETTPNGELCFEYTLQETDRSPDRVSLSASMLRYPSKSAIKDSVTDELAATMPRRTDATVYALTTSTSLTFDTGRALISKIEPAIRSVTVSSGDRIRVGVDVYGAQDIKDNDLADGIGFLWNDDGGGGNFVGNGREVTYTSPEQPGTYTISVATPFSACRAPATDEVRCETTFEVRVRRPSVAQPEAEAPVNPPGAIPELLADPDGNQYEVFTPMEGGTFSGEGYSIVAPSGAIPNSEFIGVRMSDDDAASNVGMTRQRYTLGGNMYGVHAVDGSGAAISSYALDAPATVCLPLPDELRSNISDLAVVAINGDGSLTILSAQVRISTAGTMVCGGLSNLPASVAVGSAGAPIGFPTAMPEPTPVAPDTGGTAPASSMALWALLFGIAAVVIGTFIAIGLRRRWAMPSP